MTSETAVTTNTNAGPCTPSCPPPPAGGTNLSLNYSYQATAGQMGVGTTAGNAGQLMAINNNSTIGGVAESASYTYDNYGRLVTSNQTSNGSSAQRRFSYDRWGNRSGVWNATNGGTQIQSVSNQTASFPGTGSAATNRITSVTSGTTLTYSYDTNGNVTNDGLHSYTYDSENRVVNVDNGAAVYAYDHQNRRYKKTVGSTVTLYVREGSQVVGEYNGSTGAMLVQYGYAGNRTIAKTAGGVTQYFLSDRLSVRLALSDVGVVVGRQATLPFGEDFAESGSQEKHHFTSYERDSESGLDYAVNRSHAPNIGRFQQADPYMPSGGNADPQSWNRYAYVGNDPVNFNDPSGLLKIYFYIPAGLGEGNGPGYYVMTIPDPPGEAGDGTGRVVPYIEAKLEEFLRDHPNCAKKFKNLHVPINSSAPDDLASTLGSTAKSSRFVNLLANPDIMSQTPQQLGWNRNYWGGQYNIALSAYFGGSGSGFTVGPDGSTIVAHTERATHEIFVGHNYDILDNRTQGETVVHELLHLVYGGHPDIAVSLHIPRLPSDPGQIGDGAASNTIDAWLKKDCPPKD